MPPTERRERRSFLRPVQSAWEQALEAFRVELRNRIDRERPDVSAEVKEAIERRAIATYEEGLRRLVGRSSAGQEALAARLIVAEVRGTRGAGPWRRLMKRLTRIFSPQ